MTEQFSCILRRVENEWRLKVDLDQPSQEHVQNMHAQDYVVDDGVAASLLGAASAGITLDNQDLSQRIMRFFTTTGR